MDVVRTEAVEAELTRMIEKRSRKGEVDPEELEPSYAESVRRFNARWREENRLAWSDYFSRLALKAPARREKCDRRAVLLTNTEEKIS